MISTTSRPLLKEIPPASILVGSLQAATQYAHHTLCKPIMSSLSATQSDGYYLPPEYFESGAYKKVSRNRFAAESESKSKSKSQASNSGSKPKVGHNQWLKHGVVRFELAEKASAISNLRSSSFMRSCEPELFGRFAMTMQVRLS